VARTLSQPEGGWLTSRELARYILDLEGVNEVRWDKRGAVRTEDYNFILCKRK